MIATITFGPSLDYEMNADRWEEGRVNRASSQTFRYGGKGVNVAAVARRLGADVRAYGLIGGFVGEEIARLTAEENLPCDWTRVGGCSRINVKLRASDGTVTEINGRGVTPTAQERARFIERLQSIGDGPVVVSGSADPDFLEETLGAISSRALVADTSGEALLRALPFRPLMIKPNADELGEIFGCRPTDEDAIARYADRLRERGAKNVVVTMGGAGALMCAEDGRRYRAKAPCGHATDPVGAGDAAVAGWITAWTETGDVVRSLVRAVAAGSASAFSGRNPDRRQIEKLEREIRVETFKA